MFIKKTTLSLARSLSPSLSHRLLVPPNPTAVRVPLLPPPDPTEDDGRELDTLLLPPPDPIEDDGCELDTLLKAELDGVHRPPLEVVVPMA